MGDLKLDLSTQMLCDVVGGDTFSKLQALFPGTCDTIKLRRCSAHGECINFHTDDEHNGAKLTMQIPLNGDDAYVGGRLVYATTRGFVEPWRPAGSVTIHNNQIVHGVSNMMEGVRYGLFFLEH